MKEISIKIRFQEWNYEFHADIFLDHNKARYLASDSLERLMLDVSRTVLAEKVYSE